MAIQDEALLDAYRRGDEGALEALLERYEPAVYRFGLKMCRDPEDAKDVLQETLLAAARGARDFRGGATLSTWLYTIARSFCVKKRRRRVGAPEHEMSLDDEEVGAMLAPGPAPDEAAEGHEIAAALDAAIGALELGQREVLLLRDVEGLTAPEVASVLGIGIDAVKSRLHRARAAVRARLSPLLEPAALGPARGCPDVAAMLSRYVEGEIGAADCAEMERHVEGCAPCSARCEGFRRVLALCRSSATAGEVPADVQREVRRALADVR